MSTKPSKKKQQSNLIVIDKITDLIRVPLHQLSTVKLSNFTGKYYRQLFEEALILEQEIINGKKNKDNEKNDTNPLEESTQNDTETQDKEEPDFQLQPVVDSIKRIKTQSNTRNIKNNLSIITNKENNNQEKVIPKSEINGAFNNMPRNNDDSNININHKSMPFQRNDNGNFIKNVNTQVLRSCKRLNYNDLNNNINYEEPIINNNQFINTETNENNQNSRIEFGNINRCRTENFDTYLRTDYRNETNNNNINGPRRNNIHYPPPIKTKNTNNAVEFEQQDNKRNYYMNNNNNNGNFNSYYNNNNCNGNFNKNNYNKNNYRNNNNNNRNNGNINKVNSSGMNNNNLAYYKANNTNTFNSIIKRIVFSINYNTIYGEEMGVIGSIPQLGNWSEYKLLKLKWNSGNNWSGTILFEPNIKDFEFKFVIMENKKVVTWEGGENNKFILTYTLNEIKYKPKGFLNKYEYEFNSNNGELKLISNWNE